MGIVCRRLLAGTIFCLLILVACMQPPPAPPAPSPPPPASATALAPTPTTVRLPTSTPVAAPALLPAPLYFIDEGQIQRLEADAQTRRQITSELAPRLTAGAVREFDLASNGDLVYVIDTRIGGTALVYSDARGNRRRVLYERAGVEVSRPRWSPDAATIAVRLAPDPAHAPDLVGGVYLISGTVPAPVDQAPPTTPEAYLPLVRGPSRQPQLLQADDTLDLNADPPSRQYAPHRWSPDGSRLALDGYYYTNRTCSVAVKELASAALITPRSPIEDAVLACSTPVWSRDGTSLFTNLQPLGMPVLATGLWVAAPWNGDVVPLVEAQVGEQRVLAMFPHETANRNILLFLTRTTRKPDPFYSPPLEYAMYRLANETGLSAVQPTSFQLRDVRWASDDSGAAIIYLRDLIPTLAWLPAAGGAVLDLDAEGSDVSHVHWGVP